MCPCVTHLLKSSRALQLQLQRCAALGAEVLSACCAVPAAAGNACVSMVMPAVVRAMCSWAPSANARTVLAARYRCHVWALVVVSWAWHVSLGRE